MTLNPQVSLIKKQKVHFTPLYKVIMLLILFSAIILPILRMLFGISKEDIIAVFSDPNIGTVLVNSLKVAVTSTLITVFIAYFLAYCSERVNIKCVGLFSVIWILPMLIPSISHGMGLITIFGNNGILTNLFGLTKGLYGFWGIVLGSFLYSIPVAYIMIRDIMKYEDGSPYEAATVLGLSKARQFKVITLPFLRKPLISVVFAVFTMVVTDYGVPLMIGGKYKTLPVVMYQDVIGQLKFENGSVYGVILLIPAVAAFLFDLFNKDKANSAFVLKPIEKNNGIIMKCVSYLYCTFISLVTLTPIFSFLIWGFAKRYPTDMSFSFDNLERVLTKSGGDKYLLNSVVIAFFVALIGTAIGFVTAYFTARMKSPLSRVLHLISITAMAIPGIVLGLSYVIMFNGSFIYGTIVILVMVNIVHFIASPYLMMYNSLAKVNENLEAVGDTLGISRLRLVKDVFIPQCKSTLAEMFMYFFVNSMMTISAVSFLWSTSTKPISLMINQFEAQSQYGNAAIVSLLILIINMLLKGGLALIQKCKKN